jgi:protein phosphatase 1G
MEDSILYDRLESEIFLFGIFDGHGGAEVSQFCSTHFALLMKENEFYKQQRYDQALISVFAKLDEIMDTEGGEK